MAPRRGLGQTYFSPISHPSKEKHVSFYKCSRHYPRSSKPSHMLFHLLRMSFPLCPPHKSPPTQQGSLPASPSQRPSTSQGQAAPWGSVSTHVTGLVPTIGFPSCLEVTATQSSPPVPPPRLNQATEVFSYGSGALI